MKVLKNVTQPIDVVTLTVCSNDLDITVDVVLRTTGAGLNPDVIPKENVRNPFINTQEPTQKLPVTTEKDFARVVTVLTNKIIIILLP